MLRVVHMENVDAIKPQRLQAFVERAPGAPCVKTPVLKVAIEFRGNCEPFREAAPLADNLADALLAAAGAVNT